MRQLVKKFDGCLIPIIILSLMINLLGIWNIKTVNSYYLAAIYSMSQSLHNLFFASFDPAGFVSIDKPPLAFWIQIFSVKLFGIHSWSVILPQALAETGSVLILYFLVKPAFGAASARIAALIMAVTPVAVAVARTNNVDSILVFLLLMATFFLFKAADSSKRQTLWLSLAFAFIGLGFNVKMMQAYMILPAFFIFVFTATKESWGKKLLRLFPPLFLLAALSLSWAFAVDSVAKQSRPYVGSSSGNSVTQLALGYNGMQRLFGHSAEAFSSSVSSPESSAAISPTRLFRVGYGTQISWLLPLVFLSIPVIINQLIKEDRHHWYRTKKGRETIFWICCFIPMFIIFSFAGFVHRYYFIMLAPSIAVICGIGWRLMFQLCERQNNLFKPCILPISLLLTLILQCVYVGYYAPTASALLATTGFVLFTFFFFKGKHLRSRKTKTVFFHWGQITLLSTLLLAPVYWSLTPLLFGGNNVMPEAGPQLADIDRIGRAPVLQADNHLIHYLETHVHEESRTFLFGTINAPTAAPYIIQTRKPVMALGGFNGTDPILSLKAFQWLIKEGRIQYFYIPASKQNTHSPVIQWIQIHGRLIPNHQWDGTLQTVQQDHYKAGVEGRLYKLNSTSS